MNVLAHMGCARVVVALAISTVLIGLPVQAGDLYVAGTIGEVYMGDSETGNFALFGGTCLAPVRALATDNSNIYAGDDTGAILAFELATGNLVNTFFMPAGVTAMVVHNGDLLVSESFGLIRRVDPNTGDILDTLTSPIGINAMMLRDGLVYVGGPTGDVWKADANIGEFSYFGCACSGNVQALAHDDVFLYAADEFGFFLSYDLATGWLMGEGFLPFGVSDMIRDGQHLLISELNGNVHRVDPQTMNILDTMVASITVDAMTMPEFGPGDCNADGSVNLVDFAIFASCFGLSSPNANCDASEFACSDLDGNLNVDLVDFASFALEFSQ